MSSIEGLTVSFGGFTLLDSISFVVGKKDRIALVGKNGTRKSTLLRILVGLQEPTQGPYHNAKKYDFRLSSTTDAID